MKRDNLFLKHWYLWLLVLFLPLGLYWIISRPCGFDAIGAEKASEIWLGFWGGYLGAVISAAVAFFILDKQLKANAKENEDNRIANKEANRATQLTNKRQNEKNREHQVNQLQYQQKMQWLNDFKQMAAEYAIVFNNNNLVIAQNSLAINPDETYHITRKILDDLQMAKTKMNLYKGDDEYAMALDGELKEKYNTFSNVVLDIHCLANRVTICKSKPNKEIFSMNIENMDVINDTAGPFSNEIRLLVAQTDKQLGVTYEVIMHLAQQRRKSVEKILQDVSDILVAYTKAEQERTNRILLD